MKKSVKYMIGILFSTLLLGGMTACGESRTPNSPTQLSSPTDLYLSINLNDDQTEYLFTWDMVKEADGYTISVDGNPVAEDIPVYLEEYDLTPYLVAGNQHEISIIAVDNDTDYLSSEQAILTATAEIPTAGIDYIYNYTSSEYAVTRGECPFTKQKIVLPDYYNDIEITQISDWAFGKAEQDVWGSQPYLKDIRFPRFLRTIGKNAFSHCANLEKIILPASLQIIDESAFYSCKKLQTTLPINLIKIGDYAFFKCEGLSFKIFPNSLTHIGESAFGSCIGFTEITIPDAIAYLGEGAFYSCDNLAQIHIPSDIDYLGGEIFHGTKWYVDQPNGIICLGNVLYTYKGEMPKNTVLTNFPDGITKIADNAFNGQTNLISVTIPEGWTTVTGTGVFKNCSSLQTVNLPESFKNIEREMFYGCASLANIIIPKNVEHIGDMAFQNCTELQSVTLPNSITKVGAFAFRNCKKLSDFICSENLKNIPNGAFYDCDSLSNFAIPDSVTKIGDFAFYNSGLRNINIPKNVKNIGTCALATSSLIEMTVDESNDRFQSIEGNLYNKSGKKLIQYSLGKTSESFTVPEGVTIIGESAFCGALNLKQINFPKSLTHINANAFESTGLTDVVLNYGILFIGASAFGGEQNLNSIILPSSIQVIENGFWVDCIYYTTGPTQWEEITFADRDNPLIGTDFVVYFYSESEPPLNEDGTAYNGNYWHYAEDGITPVVWEL